MQEEPVPAPWRQASERQRTKRARASWQRGLVPALVRASVPVALRMHALKLSSPPLSSCARPLGCISPRLLRLLPLPPPPLSLPAGALWHERSPPHRSRGRRCLWARSKEAALRMAQSLAESALYQRPSGTLYYHCSRG